MSHRRPVEALDLVLRSVDAVRNLRALYVLLATFAAAGLCTTMAQAAAGSTGALAVIEAAAALFIAFYGGNAAGILVMDDASGRPVRDVGDALRCSLLTSHRLLFVLSMVLGAGAVFAGVLWGVLWLCRPAVSGPLVGPLLLAFVVPVAVVAVGLAVLALTTIIVPLSAPAVWCGEPSLAIVRRHARWIRRRLVTATFLMALVSLLTAAAGAIVTFVVAMGGRVVSQLAVAVVGIELPTQLFMAGLLGRGLRVLGPGAAVAGGPHAAAALAGAGVVFALALVLPGMVYLRGTCEVYLAMLDTER